MKRGKRAVVVKKRSFSGGIIFVAVIILTAAVLTGANALRCDYCGKPISGEYTVSDGNNYHVKCYEDHIALHCKLCGEIINGRYYEDYWGNTVHAEHKGQSPQCEYCRRFLSDGISEGGFEYGDGRLICGICLKSAVRDDGEARRIMSEILGILNRNGIEIDISGIPLYLVDKKAMAEHAVGFHADPLGFTHYEQTSYGGGIITDRSFKIYMLNGLPRYEFISALAHEMMHVWLFSNGMADIEASMREGSCNYAGYLTLLDYSGRKAQFVISNMMSDSDPVYGDGFRHVKEFVEKKGIAYWLDYLKNNKSAPR